MLSRESVEEKSRGWKVVERPGWTIGWTATKGLSEPLLLDGENVRRLKLRAMSYEKDVVMQRHGVVMGPQAVCAVTAGLSGPGGDNGYWWRAGQRLRRTANFKPTPKSSLPFSKLHTQRKKGRNSFTAKSSSLLLLVLGVLFKWVVRGDRDSGSSVESFHQVLPCWCTPRDGEVGRPIARKAHPGQPSNSIQA